MVKEMRPLISVIVPVYKVETYLNNCIKSIVNQSYSNIEIILVDDGSPDNCPALCDEWAKKDKRIKVIHKKNGGVSSARNSGLDLASGKYIGFVDGDDFIHKDMIDYLYKAMDSDSSQMASCGYRLSGKIYCCNNKKLISNIQALSYLFNIIDCPYFEGFVWNKLYLLQIIKDNNIRFDEELDMCEDTLFNFDYLNNVNKVSILNYSFYEYTFRNDSVMRIKPIKNDIKMLSLINYFLNCSKEITVKKFIIRWAFKYWIKIIDDCLICDLEKSYYDSSLKLIKTQKNFILKDSYFTFVEKVFTILLCHFKWVYKLYKKFKYFKRRKHDYES